MMTVADVAHRWRISQAVLRRHIRTGSLDAVRVGRAWRIRLEDVLNAEAGIAGGGPLLTKAEVARAYAVSLRTVDRWIAAELQICWPLGLLRLDPNQVSAGLEQRVGDTRP